MVGVGCSAPRTSTASIGSPISSWASRSAVWTRSSSVSSSRPPGNEISPAWRRRSSRRRVKTACSSPSRSKSGTRTAASVRPWTSSAAASRASSRTPRSASFVNALGGVRGRGDALGPLGEHDLALERAVHRALGGDDPQALDLLGRHAGRQPQHEVELRRAPALGRGVLDGHLALGDVPPLAGGVHLHRDRGTRREAGREQLLRARRGVLPAVVLGLVGRHRVRADRDLVAVGAGASCGGLHGPFEDTPYESSGLNNSPVSTFGKKYVLLGGIEAPEAATSRTCSTGVARSRKARSYSPDSTRATACAASRA